MARQSTQIDLTILEPNAISPPDEYPLPFREAGKRGDPPGRSQSTKPSKRRRIRNPRKTLICDCTDFDNAPDDYPEPIVAKKCES